MLLKDKVILIISPQAWGTVWVSKHHYALKLAERGSKVYFLNPPLLGRPKGKSQVEIHPSGVHRDLFIVHDFISFPYLIKYHFPSLFYFLIKSHIKNIKKAIGVPLDLVWSFDLSNVYPLQYFTDCSLRIFHPVDMPHSPSGIDAALGADLLFSTSAEILSRYSNYKLPSFFIDHGIADVFLTSGSENIKLDEVHVGYSGNLLRHDIDRNCLLEIIRAHPDVKFEFWGPYSQEQANIGGEGDSSSLIFIKNLKTSPNVKLHGPVSYDTLAAEYSRMNAFLICYDLSAKNAVGPNYHKLMEYLSSGRVVISSHISLYEERPELVEMVSEKSNEGLPQLFASVIEKLDWYNSPEKMQIRKDFARSNSYVAQLDRIENILSSMPLAEFQESRDS